MRRFHLAVLLGTMCLGSVGIAAGQSVPPAEFRTALSFFEAEQYDDAARAFERVYAERGGTWATAAWVMSGKALFRAGRYAEARDRLRSFLDDHADSKYADEALRTLEYATTAQTLLEQRPKQIGIVLSLSGDEAAQSQAIFNGIRMAVEEHNEGASGGDRLRLVFRDIGAEPEGAGRAVRALADEGVPVIVGALFSEQALEAAAVAESERVVFVAPLATDDRVSRNRTFVFQANPTIATRGRLLGRFAVNGLLLRRFAILSGFDPQGFSRTMAEAFEDEVVSLGASVVYTRYLSSSTDWSRLADLIPPDSLSRARGLFVPLSGRQPERQAASLIDALQTLGADLRVIGNADWNQLPLPTQADPYGVTYANDFRTDPSDRTTSAFLRAHRSRFGSEAGRLGHVGYDVTRFLIRAMASKSSSAEVADALRASSKFEGTGMRIDFRGGQVNEAMFYQRYREGRIELLR